MVRASEKVEVSFCQTLFFARAGDKSSPMQSHSDAELVAESRLHFSCRISPVAIVLAVAAALRVGSILLLRSFLHPVTWEFGEIAHTVVAGLGYSISLPNGGRAPSAYMPPAYPYMLVLLFRLHGDNLAGYLILELIQAGMGVLLVYVIYRMALLLAGKRVAVASASLVAIFPTQVYACNEFHSINFYMVLGAAGVYYLIRYMGQDRPRRDLEAAGLCMGMLLLFRSEALILVLIYAAILIWRLAFDAIKPAAMFVCISLACLAPWTVRNYVVFGKVVPTTDSGGKNLWIGNNPHATGSQHYDFTQFFSEDLKQRLGSIAQDRDYEPAGDKVFEENAFHFIRGNPGAEARLSLRKLWIYFAFDPSHEKGRRPSYWLPSVLLSFLAIWGAVLRRRHLLQEDLIVVATILFAVAVSCAVFVLPRYKIVIDPFLMFFAGNAMSWIYTKLRPQVEVAEVAVR